MYRPVFRAGGPGVVLVVLTLLASGVNVPVGAAPSHGPIAVYSDSALASLATDEGWPGSGTASDPYVLEAHSFAVGPTETAIEIGGIRAHWILRDLTITGGAIGIKLNNSPNVVIEHSTFDDPAAGIILAGVATVHNNSIEATGSGIRLVNAGAATIADNAIRSTPTGILVRFSDDTRILRNQIDGVTDGITVLGSSGLRLDGNEIYTVIGKGISLQDARDITLDGGRVQGASQGIVAADTTFASLDGVKATGNTEGIRIEGRTGHSLSNIELSTNTKGLVVSQSHQVSIRNALAEDNDIGIQLLSSNKATVTGSTFRGNGDGITVFIGSDPEMTDNVFENNTVGTRLHIASRAVVDEARFSDNTVGIQTSATSNAVVQNTRFENNGEAIRLERGRANTIFHNVFDGDDTALRMTSSSANLVYDNLFDADRNVRISGGTDNAWSTDRHSGRNILGGLWRGGNWWNEATSVDVDGDWLSEVPHTLIPVSDKNLTPVLDGLGVSSGYQDLHPLVGPDRVHSPHL